ncbi:MAG TPA: glycosyltransferase family 9 protein, partial [Gemmatimonadaceae bacterium]|nr:glycosyltransferase family 9 protein [Gemmatimonadaceae bacterium]
QRAFVSGIERPIAAIVVATSKPEKDWIPERWAEVCDVLYDQYGMQPVLLGGNSEREATAARIIADNASHKPVCALGSGLRNLVSIMDAGELILSPDTGPLHIAVALGKPVISLMGYTDPRRTGPWRSFHDLLIDAYHDEGQKGPVTMETRRGRMTRISVSDVIDKVRVWDERYRGKS